MAKDCKVFWCTNDCAAKRNSYHILYKLKVAFNGISWKQINCIHIRKSFKLTTQKDIKFKHE